MNAQEVQIDLSHYTKLAHAVAHKSEPLAYVLNVEYEDLYQIAMIGIWTASIKFKANQGVKFTTFAYSVAYYDILKYLRGLRAKCRTATLVYLDSTLNGDTLTAWHNVTRDKSADIAFEEVDSILDLQATLKTKKLSIGEKKVINCIVKTNKTLQRDIGKHIGLSQTQVWRLVSKLKIKLAN